MFLDATGSTMRGTLGLAKAVKRGAGQTTVIVR